MRRVRWITIAGVFVAYALLSQYSADPTHPHARALGAALSIGPVLLIGLVVLWVWKWRLSALSIALVSGVLLYLRWPFIESHYEWSDLAQQCGIYGLVALFFARSLFAGHVPVCEQLARQMYGGELSSPEIVYMRRATAAWAVFYFLLTVAILVLFFVVPLRVWSLFTNFVIWGLMVVAGFVDHALRQLVLPRRGQGGILTLIRRALTT